MSQYPAYRVLDEVSPEGLNPDMLGWIGRQAGTGNWCHKCAASGGRWEVVGRAELSKAAFLAWICEQARVAEGAGHDA